MAEGIKVGKFITRGGYPACVLFKRTHPAEGCEQSNRMWVGEVFNGKAWELCTWNDMGRAQFSSQDLILDTAFCFFNAYKEYVSGIRRTLEEANQTAAPGLRQAILRVELDAANEPDWTTVVAVDALGRPIAKKASK